MEKIGELEYIMEDWKEYKLGDIALNITDGTHSTVIDDINGEYFLLSCKNIKNGVIQISSSERKINEATFNKLHRRTKLEKDDVLVTTVGTIGEMAIVPIDNPNYEFQRSVGIVKPNQNRILPKFLYYSLKNELPQISNRVTGAVQQCLFLGDIKDLTINLPPLPTQQKIAQILSSLDDKIELNNKINANLEQQAQALFKSWFVDFEPFGGEMPAEWKVGKLSEIIDIRDGTHDSPKFYDEGYPLVTSKHLDSFKINFSDMKYITEADYEKINERSKVDTGDILYSMIGTVGIISLVIDNPVQFAIKNVGLFKTSQNPVYKFFVLNYLKTQEIKNYIEQHLAGSTQKYISLSELRNIPLYIPDTNILEKFNSLVEPITNGIINNVEENNRLSNLRDTLLPKLMNGEIEV